MFPPSILPLDLSEQQSVDALHAREPPPLAGLVRNAGGPSIAAPTRTAEGRETTFAVDQLGRCLPARLLLPVLAPGGRVVFVASDTHDPEQKAGIPVHGHAGDAGSSDLTAEAAVRTPSAPEASTRTVVADAELRPEGGWTTVRSSTSSRPAVKARRHPVHRERRRALHGQSVSGTVGEELDGFGDRGAGEAPLHDPRRASGTKPRLAARCLTTARRMPCAPASSLGCAPV